MALPGSSAFFKAPTALEQLLEEINFQRTKEMRQLMKDDSGFVVLQGTSYWTDLFVRHFLFQTEHCIDCDDLLFFVRKKHIKSSSRFLPKFETEVDVFRKASRKLPIGDPDMDWEETVYLNLIIHQFDYTLTLAICTRTSPKELQVLKRHSQKVYASPSRRRMDTKAEAEEMTYPNICFMVDNFNEVFCDILVRDGEMVCVELVASDRDGAVQGVIFLGSIRYDALKRVYDARSSLSSKVAQRMTFGLFSNASSQRVEFVRMKGPQGKGHAEMAVTKPKGYGAETPTSEPGYCATDMWDSDWDSDPEDFFVYRHQRRLSDPSANINNFVRGGWKTKPADSAGAKSRSENEGLDSLANGLNEIEAGDIRDDCEFCKKSGSTSLSPNATSAPIIPDSHPSIIASFFPVNKTQSSDKSPVKVRPASSVSPPCTLSESHASPENLSLQEPAQARTDECTGGVDDPTPVGTPVEPPVDSPALLPAGLSNDAANKVEETEDEDDEFEDCLSSLSEATTAAAAASSGSPEDSPLHRADVWRDATDVCVHNQSEDCESCALEKLAITNNQNSNTGSSAYQAGEGELPASESEKTDSKEETETKDCEETKRCRHGVEGSCILCGDRQRRPLFAKLRERHEAQVRLLEKERRLLRSNGNGNGGRTSPEAQAEAKARNPRPETERERQCMHCHCHLQRSHSHCPAPSNPLPESPSRLTVRGRRKTEASVRRDMAAVPESSEPVAETVPPVPHRVMPDGTAIYYWCDVSDRPPDQADHELDDGAYNPLWTMRGFTQTFHFWKENKRAQSVPLNAFLTYITLPWWSIAKDILDHREKPTLTF